MFNDLPEEVARKWCQLREAEVPPTLHNPFDPSLASSFLLSLFPLAPLSVPRTLHLLTPLSPQSLSLSSFKERHLRNSKNIDFFLTISTTTPPPTQYLCHGSGASCMLPLLWLLEISHAWKPQRWKDMPLYGKYSVLSLLSVCKHRCICTVHSSRTATHESRDQWPLL